MAAVTPTQLETIATFLETSREYLDIEHPIRLRWPRLAMRKPRKPGSARTPGLKPAGKRNRRPGEGRLRYPCSA